MTRAYMNLPHLNPVIVAALIQKDLKTILGGKLELRREKVAVLSKLLSEKRNVILVAAR